MATRAEMVKHDYISREAALDAVDVCNLHRGIIDALQAIISDIPAADVRPVVSAEWERPKGSTSRSWIFVCSKCGDRAYFPVPKYFPKGCGYSFCPNCGADMREVQSNG